MLKFCTKRFIFTILYIYNRRNVSFNIHQTFLCEDGRFCLFKFLLFAIRKCNVLCTWIIVFPSNVSPRAIQSSPIALYVRTTMLARSYAVLCEARHIYIYTGSFKKIWTIKTCSREEYHIATDQIWRTIHCWMEPHATITVMLGTSLTRRCRIDGLEEQSTMINIF